MTERKQPNKNPRLIDWTPDPKVNERWLAYNAKVRRLVLDIQHQHGLESGPRPLLPNDSPNLTKAMTGLVEGFKLALFCELADMAPQPLRSGLLPALAELVPEEQFQSVLSAMRDAAKRLHDEDDTMTMAVTRFFAKLRDERKEG